VRSLNHFFKVRGWLELLLSGAQRTIKKATPLVATLQLSAEQASLGMHLFRDECERPLFAIYIYDGL